jgi:hypothetical protein
MWVKKCVFFEKCVVRGKRMCVKTFFFFLWKMCGLRRNEEKDSMCETGNSAKLHFFFF